MSVTAVARRYAEALADVAIERNQAEEIDREVRVFADMLNSSRELYDVFASPIVSLADKRRVLDALVDRVGTGRLTANFLRTMLSHYRLHHLSQVYERFRSELNERRGVIVAEVTTAAEIGADEHQKLGRILQELTGRKVEFKFKTDSSLIGGLVTRIGSVVYDGSVRTQLREIKERLKQGDRV